MLEEFKARFRDLDLRREAKRGTSVYNGIFNLLVLNSARDWMTGGVHVDQQVNDRHIVPKGWGNEQALDSSIDSILNRTPLNAETDRQVINHRLPNAYLPQLIKQNGEQAVRAILESHFISPRAFDILMKDPFTPEDYESFLLERQRTIQEAIENLLIKERLGLEPRLRELDAELEATELQLRALIFTTLEGDIGKLPPGVIAKTDERIKSATRRNPALDENHLESLAGRLEYCDLRELEHVIANKGLWSLFESKFGSKEVLAGRFNQMAELRNCIRHHRSASEVVRKDGEAALSWFSGVLAPLDN